MANLAVLVPIALAMGVVGLATFLWSLRHGQYEDLDGAGERIFLEDETDAGHEGAASERRNARARASGLKGGGKE